MPRLRPRRSLRKGKREKHPHAKQRKWVLRQLITREKGLCTYCLDPVNLIHGDPHQATIDHVIPLSSGGPDILSNLRLACYRCNSEKGSGVAVDIYLDEE